MKVILNDEETTKNEIGIIPLFSIVKMQVQYIDRQGIDQGYKPQDDKTGFKAVVELGDIDALATVKPRYKLLQFATPYNRFTTQLKNQGITFQGKVIYYRGKAILFILPGNQKTGIAIYNSVDGTNAITQRFFMYDRTTQELILLPRLKGLAFSNRHTTHSTSQAEELLKWTGQISQQFDIIQTEMVKCQMTEDTIKELNTALKLDTKKAEKLYIMLKQNGLNLWQYFLEAFKIAQDRKFKSEIHQSKKEDKITETFFKVVVEKLNAQLKANAFIMEFI
jgi:Fe-S cluster assembly iron-binding protein IscA